MGSDCSCTRCGLRTSSDSATSSMRCCCPRSAPKRSHARRARGRPEKAARRGGGRRRSRYEHARKACGRLRPLPRTAAPRRISRSCPPYKQKQAKQAIAFDRDQLQSGATRAVRAGDSTTTKKRGATSPPHHRAPHGNSEGDQEPPRREPPDKPDPAPRVRRQGEGSRRRGGGAPGKLARGAPLGYSIICPGSHPSATTCIRSRSALCRFRSSSDRCHASATPPP